MHARAICLHTLTYIGAHNTNIRNERLQWKIFVNIYGSVRVCASGGARELSPTKLTVSYRTLRIALESPARVGISVLSKSK